MLYFLLLPLKDVIPGLNLIRYITFRSAAAAITALIIALILGPLFIKLLKKYQIKEKIRQDGPASHQSKAGTPTMGGLIILAAIVIPTLLWADLSNYHVLMVLLVTLWLGLIGYIDDYLKAVKHNPKGMVARTKFAGQIVLGLVFGLLLLYVAPEGHYDGSTSIPFVKNYVLVLGALYIPFIVLVITGASNAVNLTDGLDGLAAGSSTMVFAAFGIINMWQFNQSCAWGESASARCYEVRDPYDLAVVSFALAGACFGFLWWNAKPAKIFMGDAGSLSLGGALAGLAVMSRTELLLLVIGGLFVLITLSVIIQTGWFKITKHLTGTGKRVFKMAPLQHHFEMLGWSEVTIVIRFWIIAGCFVALGMGIFYGEWVTGMTAQ